MRWDSDRTDDAVRWLRLSDHIDAAVDAIAMREMFFRERLDTLGRFRTGIHRDGRNFAIVRQCALNLLRQERTVHVSINAKRLKAVWSDDRLARAPVYRRRDCPDKSRQRSAAYMSAR